MCRVNVAECLHEKRQDLSANNLLKGPIAILNSQTAWLVSAIALERQITLKSFTRIVTK